MDNAGALLCGARDEALFPDDTGTLANHRQLIGVESNRSAIGAQVTAAYGGRRQAQAVLAQSSYLSTNDRRLHFGLGAATMVDRIEVRWPAGKKQEWKRVPPDQTVTLTEGQSEIEARPYQHVNRIP